MNLNVVLRHELHALINRASADQLFVALHSPQSPIRDRFIRFLALSYADWLSTQNDIDDDDIKKEWKHALKMQPDGLVIQLNNKGNNNNNIDDKPHLSNNNNKIQTSSQLQQNNDDNNQQQISSSISSSGTSVNNNNSLNGDLLNGSHPPQFELQEKALFVGFKKVWSDNDDDVKTKITEIITNNPDYQKLNKQNQIFQQQSQSLLNDDMQNDQLLNSIQNINDPNMNNSQSTNNNQTNQPNQINQPMSIEQENMKKFFEMLTVEQQQLLKSKLPLLSDVGTLDKRNEILVKKLELCSTTFDFLTTNPLELKGIEKKKQMLTEILEYIARYSWYNESILERCISTISYNLFRALPRSGKNPDVEDEPFEDPAWAHLQLIYDLTLRLVINTDVDKKTMKKYLEGVFVDNVIELFASEDPREREYLKTILHRIYGRFMPLRALIRQSIANCCYRTIYEQYTVNYHYGSKSITYHFELARNTGRIDKSYYQNSIRNENGIAEFLEIFCSIIHGFSIPVKKEHKDFLRNVLVPLHKCRKLEKFHEQLVACCVQFVFKDPSVAPVILGGLLKFWPLQSPTKEEMFIAEVVNVVNAMINHKNGFSWPENRDICLSIIDILVKCMKSHHHSVAERALLVWGEDAIEILIDLDKKTIWPKIVRAFLDNKNHWNESLRECNEEAMDVFKVRDPQTFNKIREEYEKNMKKPPIKKQTPNNNQSKRPRSDKWAKLKAIAAANKAKISKKNTKK